MSRKTLELNYKESQIIKHSIQNNIVSKGHNLYLAKDKDRVLKDIEEEKRLLKRVEEFVGKYKQHIGI